MSRHDDATELASDTIGDALADLLTLAMRGGSVCDAIRLEIASRDYAAGHIADAADGVESVVRISPSAVLRMRAAEVAAAMAG